jgi:hypothetical protein
MNIQENIPDKYEEGPVARTIEKQTSRLPSDLFLWGALGAMGASLIAQLTQPKKRTFFNMPSRSGQIGLFFGQWVPTLLLFGIYNKIVKVAGHDAKRPPTAVGAMH